jgi:hypothetical protein
MKICYYDNVFFLLVTGHVAMVTEHVAMISMLGWSLTGYRDNFRLWVPRNRSPLQDRIIWIGHMVTDRARYWGVPPLECKIPNPYYFSVCPIQGFKNKMDTTDIWKEKTVSSKMKLRSRMMESIRFWLKSDYRMAMRERAKINLHSMNNTAK